MGFRIAIPPVMRLAAICLFAAPVAFLPAPAIAQVEKPASGLIGKVYDGVLSARVIPPRGSGVRATSHRGQATAVLETTSRGKANFILNGTVAQDGDASFLAPGTLSGKTWAGKSETFHLTIDAHGKVAGRGTFQGQPMTFDGTYSGNDLRLLVELTTPRATEGGLPAGTRFQFLYQLRYIPPSARESASGGGGSDGGCREVVYRLKLTPNLFGGGLSSVRVPECRH